MSQEKADQVLELLQKIHQAQLTALDRQARQLEISEILLARTEEQYNRASQITNKAEAIQEKAGKAIKALMILAAVAIVIIVLSWCF